MNNCDIIRPDAEKGVRRVGYAYVPVQRIGKVYTPSKALMQGTVFPELDIGIDEYLRGLWNGK